MVALYDLAAASFRGVSFLVPHDSAEEGRNTIGHLYPDSNRRYAEDNGYTPPEFHVTAILRGTGLMAKFSALRSALNRAGPGTLKHPWYGSQYVAVVGPWKVTRDDKDSGVLTLDIKFAVTSGSLYPGLVAGIAATVTSLAGATISTLMADLGAAWSVPRNAVSGSAVASALSAIGTQVAQSFGSVSDLTGAATAMSTAPERLMGDGLLVATAMETLFRAPFEDLSVDGTALSTGFAAVHEVSAGIVDEALAILPTTLDLAERQAILLDIGMAGMAASVAALAEAAAGTTWHSADAVHIAEQNLVNRHQIIQAADTARLTAIAATQLADTVAAALDVLKNQELRLPRIDPLAITNMPASYLAYMLYETFDRTQTIVDLNLDQHPGLLDERALVLMDVAA